MYDDDCDDEVAYPFFSKASARGLPGNRLKFSRNPYETEQLGSHPSQRLSIQVVDTQIAIKKQGRPNKTTYEVMKNLIKWMIMDESWAITTI